MASAPATTGLARSYRRAHLLGLVTGVVTLVVSLLVHHVDIGAFVAVGIGMGIWNSFRVTESYPKVTADGAVNGKALSISGLRRLGYITFIALVFAIGFRPHGWTVAIGLAAYQLILIANTAGPLMREVRSG